MNKYLATLFLTALFVVPFVSQAASVGEQRTVILSQIIALLKAEIASLQEQLKGQEPIDVRFGSIEATTTEATTTPSFFTCTYSKDPSGQSHRSCGG